MHRNPEIHIPEPAPNPPRHTARAWHWLLIAAVLALLATAPRVAPLGHHDRSQASGAVVISAAGPRLPSGAVRFMSIDRTGTVWFRIAGPGGQPDRAIRIDAAGRRRDYRDLRAAVESNRAAIVGQGTLLDFWAVDAKGNVWVGPAYLDQSQSWVEVARDQSYPGGGITYEQRVVIDTTGNAWVPFRTHGDCAMGGSCGGGLAGFDAAGELLRELTLDVPLELAERDLPFVRFEQFGDGAMVALAPKSAYLLPSTTPKVYPELGVDPMTGTRNAGLASASAARPDGDAAVFTWIERLVDPPIPRVAEVTGARGTWRSTDLSSSPLFDGGTRGRFITAAAYASDGTLWTASSDGELAARAGERWIEHFTAENSPLGDLIYDVAVDAAGAVWIATNRGVRVYKDGVWRTSMTLLLPSTEKVCGFLHPCPPTGR